MTSWAAARQSPAGYSRVGVLLAVKAIQPPGAPVTAGSPAGLLLAAAVTTAPPAATAEQGMPPFYVVAEHDQPVADVRRSATGQRVSSVWLPAGRTRS